MWVVIPPLETEQTRAKTCGYCDATFVFFNRELVTLEVPNTLAHRTYFKESDFKSEHRA